MERARQPHRGAVRARRAGLRGHEGRADLPFDSVDDPTPTVFADLRAQVQDFWDRGLLGLAIAPDGARRSSRTRTTPGGATPARTRGPAPPGCTIDGRLSRLDASGSEHVLITDFCQQFPSHSVGTLAFGPDGMLYMSAGEGAHFDYRRLRADRQHVRRPAGPGRRDRPARTPRAARCARRASGARPGRPFTPDGAILRLDPDPARRPIGRSTRRRLRLPQPVPLHVPAGHERDLDRRRRLDHVGGAQPDPGRRRRRAQLRLALLRGRRRASPPTTRST